MIFENIPGIGSACILLGDSITYKLRAAGKTFLFEWSDMFGPLVVGKRGQEIAQPGERSSFWEPVTLWSRQGKRLRDGFCLWTPEPLDILTPKGGRFVVEGQISQDDKW